jgi:hypothetical protein
VTIDEIVREAMRAYADRPEPDVEFDALVLELDVELEQQDRMRVVTRTCQTR